MGKTWRLWLIGACAVVGLSTGGGLSHAADGHVIVNHHQTIYRRDRQTTTLAMAITYLLPKGSELLGISPFEKPAQPNTSKADILELKINGYQYVAATFILKDRIGVMIAKHYDHALRKVWLHYGLIGESLVSLGTTDFLIGESGEVIVGTYIGASAGNQWTIIGWRDGSVQMLFQKVANRADIGALHSLSIGQIALWNHDTGPLYVIHMYEWDRNSQQFVSRPNQMFPRYFRKVVIPYYVTLARDKTVPLKMTDYGLAQGYAYAGEYKEAESMIRTALMLPGYPDNQAFFFLEKQIGQ